MTNRSCPECDQPLARGRYSTATLAVELLDTRDRLAELDPSANASKETFEPGDPADPSQPGYQQPPDRLLDMAWDELDEDASWTPGTSEPSSWKARRSLRRSRALVGGIPGE